MIMTYLFGSWWTTEEMFCWAGLLKFLGCFVISNYFSHSFATLCNIENSRDLEKYLYLSFSWFCLLSWTILGDQLNELNRSQSHRTRWIGLKSHRTKWLGLKSNNHMTSLHALQNFSSTYDKLIKGAGKL